MRVGGEFGGESGGLTTKTALVFERPHTKTLRFI